MNEASQNHLLAGSGIECRETEGQLELYLPARPGRALLKVACTLLSVGGFFAFFFFLSGEVPPLLFLLPVLGVGSVCLAFLFFIIVGTHLTTTSLLITRDSLVLTTVLFGKKDVERHALDASSRAQQRIGPTGARFANSSKMQWIQIDPQGGEVRFGYELSQAEQDCVEQRINRFLRQAAEEPLAPPPRGRRTRT
jgi:hypothetical protein